jgi:hypothetical protein
MKRLVALAAIVLGSGVFAIAAPTTVTGVLVDKGCYSKEKANTTNEHKGMGATCAQDCAKKGNQVAIVTSKGEVYDVTGALAERARVVSVEIDHTASVRDWSQFCAALMSCHRPTKTKTTFAELLLEAGVAAIIVRMAPRPEIGRAHV